MNGLLRLAGVALLAACSASCRQDAGLGDGAANQTEACDSILVFAAASTTNAVDEVRQRFTRESGIPVQTSYAASSTLAQQIVQGAEADLFISANTRWADFLAAKGLVARQRNLLANRLVVVLPADSKLEVRKPEDLLLPGIEHLALGDPQTVPAGEYAKAALTRLGLWERIEGKAVPGLDVRHALTYVETGAAEAGIVYATDAAISQKVKVAATIPASLTEPIRYPIVLLNHGAGNPGAERLYVYLASAEAAKVFRKHGYAILHEP